MHACSVNMDGSCKSETKTVSILHDESKQRERIIVNLSELIGREISCGEMCRVAYLTLGDD